MDLSKITQKINSKLAATKTIEIGGIVFELRVPSFSEQAILDEINESLTKNPDDGSIAEELARRTVAYSTVSVDGEALGEDATKVIEEVRKWPSFLVNTLGSAALNYRLEYAAQTARSVKFEWFDIEGFSLEKSEEAVKADAIEESQEREAAKTEEAPEEGTSDDA